MHILEEEENWFCFAFVLARHYKVRKIDGARPFLVPSSGSQGIFLPNPILYRDTQFSRPTNLNFAFDLFLGGLFLLCFYLFSIAVYSSSLEHRRDSEKPFV